MKTLVALLLTLTAMTADASPYYRFWRGWRRPDVNPLAFQMALTAKFIPATVNVGAGRGLLGYMPALPPEHRGDVPDEIALVVYESKAAYSAIRATPEGQAYTAMHDELFSRELGGKSTEPEPLTGPIVNEKAYDVLQSNANWQRGFVVWKISRVRGNADNYVRGVAGLANKGLASFLVLNHGGVFYEYQLWRSAYEYSVANAVIESLALNSLNRLTGGVARPATKTQSLIRYGEALNLQF
ncbi:MAG: hypothetical protein ABL958_11820 [Bdellovibrionia bacterium]